jgi:hypothetical protein
VVRLVFGPKALFCSSICNCSDSRQDVNARKSTKDAIASNILKLLRVFRHVDKMANGAFHRTILVTAKFKNKRDKQSGLARQGLVGDFLSPDI